MTRLTPLLIIACALAACGQRGQREADAPMVVSAIGGEAKPADPSAVPLDPPARILMATIAQGLVRFDAAGQIEPGLAERWIVIDDGRSFIFRIREAQWPDGEPVTAAQVVRVLRRAAAPESRNALAPFLAVIDEIVEMTPQVIEVRLKRSRPDLLKLFAQPELAIFRTGALDGSGPYRIVRDRKGGLLLRAAADPTQIESETPAEPPATVRLFGERAGRALARFKAHESDLVMGGTFVDWPVALQAAIPPANIKIEQPMGLFGLAIANRKGFLEDAANRSAVAMAIDREALTAQVSDDWTPLETLLPSQLDSAAAPAIAAWSPLPLEARRDQARTLVRAWRKAHPEPVTLRIALPDGPGGTLVWGHLAEALYAIGIRPERVGTDDRADLVLVDRVAPYDSGRWFIATACVACSEEARTLVDAARDAPDLYNRSHRIAEAEAALVADTSYIPIAQPFRWSIVALRLGAWQRNTRAWHPLNHLRNETE